MAGPRQEVPPQFAAAYRDYAEAVGRDGSLCRHARRGYLSRVRSFLAWAGPACAGGPGPLDGPAGRDAAVAGYLAWLVTARHLEASTARAHLVALDHFYGHVGLGRARVGRNPPEPRPRALDSAEQGRYLSAAAELPAARDRAIALLLFWSGLGAGELAALDVGDVQLTDGRCLVTVRGDAARQLTVTDAAACAAVAAWLADRDGRPGAGTAALFLNRRGGRLSAQAASGVVSGAASAAELAGRAGRGVSARTLRTTYGVRQLSGGADIATVAGLMGYRSLDTARTLTAIMAGAAGTAGAPVREPRVRGAARP